MTGASEAYVADCLAGLAAGGDADSRVGIAPGAEVSRQAMPPGWVSPSAGSELRPPPEPTAWVRRVLLHPRLRLG
jgi:hypothetical protein